MINLINIGGDMVDNICEYAKDNGLNEFRCTPRCVYEEKGFIEAIELAASIAENYDETDTLVAPKQIAIAIRELITGR